MTRKKAQEALEEIDVSTGSIESRIEEKDWQAVRSELTALAQILLTIAIDLDD